MPALPKKRTLDAAIWVLAATDVLAAQALPPLDRRFAMREVGSGYVDQRANRRLELTAPAELGAPQLNRDVSRSQYETMTKPTRLEKPRRWG